MTMTMNPYALRLTPSNSPFFKSQSSPRSPTKGGKSEEPGLHLRKVIGTTAASVNGFDCVATTRQFAYTAGAAAVVASVDEDLNVTQRFFRARPTVGGLSRDAGQWLLSPGTPSESRSRTFGLVKDQGTAGSPLGTPGREWSDSPSTRGLSAKDRVKAATAVALSPNGKWIAMGETGYRPRVLLFANKEDSNETPVEALAEHTFGVRSLAFSPDSRYLASLGTVNDGFLFIWLVDDRTGAMALHSSNKCTVTINAMSWIGGSLLTAGLRYVKVWRPEEDGAVAGSASSPIRTSESGKSNTYQKHKVLLGKNCLLSDLLDANFISATPVGKGKAVVCADSGEICLLDDSGKSQLLTPIAKTKFPISAAMIDRQGLLRVFGPSDCSETIDLTTLKPYTSTPLNRRHTTLPSKPGSDETNITAIATISHITVALDSRRAIILTKFKNDHDSESIRRQLPAHNDTVLGVKPYKWGVLPSAAFLTFSINGALRIWDSDGSAAAQIDVPIITSPEMYDMTNELKAVTPLDEGTHIAAGDRYGTLSIMDVATNTVAAQVRAHSAEVVDMVSMKVGGIQLIASGSRDRMIQLFSWKDSQLSLLQTLDEHAGAVTGLLFASQGDKLISCSSDRTIVVREAVLRSEDESTVVAYSIVRTISLKSSPCSMSLEASAEEILVSMMDRTIGKYNLKTGQAGFSFKCTDSDGGESTAIGKVLYAPSLNGNPTIIGVSSGDKSVRLYSEYGSLVARDWGHTEGITDVMLLQSSSTSREEEHKPSAKLVTVAADSTIFIWDTISQAAAAANEQNESDSLPEMPTTKAVTPMAPPLRKIFSYSELNKFRSREKSFDDNGESPSPIAQTPTQPPSPPRLKKRSSRASVAQPPKLEPAFRTMDISSGRRSLRKRSPSPPSPRNNSSRRDSRRPSLGMALRSKSSDTLLNQFNPNPAPPIPAPVSSFGSLTASTESVCRTLRAYRKKLSASSSSQPQQQQFDTLTSETLRELEKELKLTARLVGEKSAGKTQLDEATMAKLLDRASERIVDLLDERIRERVVEDAAAATTADSSTPATTLVDGNSSTRARSPGSARVVEEVVNTRGVDAVVGRDERVEVLAGAMAEVRLGSS